MQHGLQFNDNRPESTEDLQLKMPVYKITLIGDGAVGKTSLRDNFMGKVFKADYLETIGADFAIKKIEVHNKRMKFQIWDIAGTPNFEAVRGIFYRGALGALLVFDISRHGTLENASSWATELWKNSERGYVPVVVLGNKTDLRESCSTAVSADQGQALADNLSESSREAGFEIPYLETSAKTGGNVDRAFSLLGEGIIGYIEERLSD